MQHRRNRRRSIYHRKKKREILPLVFFLLIVGFILWAIFKVIIFLFEDISSESSSAEVQILKGQSHFRLPESNTWSLAFSEQKLWPGESIRTNDRGKSSLDIFEGNTIFLGPKTEISVVELEEKSDQAKKANLILQKGELWIKTSNEEFKSKKSEFKIQTDRIILTTKSATFDILQEETQDTIRLIKGSLHLDITKEEEDPISLTLGVGQKVVINDSSYLNLKNGKDILEIVDTPFIESEWHLKNLEIFYPQEAQSIRQQITKTTPLKTNSPEIAEGSTEVASPTIIAPKNGTTIPATKNQIKIEGTAPLNAFQIEVNGFALTQFNPGDKKWRYFAGSEWGTLLNGENKYSVITITQDGKRSIPTVLTINYEGVSGKRNKTTTKPVTKNSKEEPQTSSMTPPVITYPSALKSNSVYETAKPSITIKGTVDPKTQAVQVNGYTLKKFSPGDTYFTYTAVENGALGNMKPGKNTYHIVTLGLNGKKAETTVLIQYTPIQL